MNSRKTVFLFPGNGIHQKKMLAILGGVNDYMRKRLMEIEEISLKYYDIPLLDEEKENEIINQIRVFAAEITIAEFWERLGCAADFSIGHSLGEYAAAVYCGIMTTEDAVYMLVQRGNLLHEKEPYSTAISETSAETILNIAAEYGMKIEISAYNAPNIVTVCGKSHEIAELTEICKSHKLRFGVINKFHGAHYSGLKDSAMEFAKITKKINLTTPSKIMLHTIRTEIADLTPSNPLYWSKHIYNSVRFSDAVMSLPKEHEYRIIDIGISPVLLGPTQKNLGDEKCIYIPTVRAGRNYRQQILNAADLISESGINIDRSLLD